MNCIKTFFLFLFMLLAVAINGQEKRTLYAEQLQGEPPEIDGVINEKVWEFAEWSGDFTSWEPYDLQEPYLQSAIKILFDDNNLYVAIRAFDDEPDKIEKRLSRRDNFDGDWVGIAFDSYNDNLTAFSFAVNAAGVKNDGMVTNDSDWDETWNPVYYVRTSIDAQGWTAEFRIPNNQLRFAEAEEHVWGFQVLRYIFRKEEMSIWQAIPREAGRWVTLFGDLRGINNINPKKEVEIIPYIMGSVEKHESEPGNPFATGTAYGYNAGVDGKVAVTNDLTLNYTINPDFGQVEADPSAVNLTAYELFFREQRPFFVEGNTIYDFPLSDGGPTGRDNLFYSRRIGRRPHYSPDLEDNQFSRVTDFTRILAALKLSGKTQNGWSVGIMEALTNKEEMVIDEDGVRTRRDAEPMTNYFNTRIKKDFNQGNTVVGGMVTATNRFINDTTLDYLPEAAYTWGVDLTTFWRDRAYYFKTKLGFSHVSGSAASMTELQESPRRFFQRPDADHLSVDTTLTSLFGNGGSVEGGKSGKGNWRYGARVSWRSPQLELNDMGFLRSADIVNQSAWLRYEIFTPVGIFRRLNVGVSQWTGWDYSPMLLWYGARIWGFGQFSNYMNGELSFRRSGESINRAELFGGPAIRYPGSWAASVEYATDSRKKLIGSFDVDYGWGDQDYREDWDIELGINYRPFAALQLSVDPQFQYWNEDARYAEIIEKEGEEDKYIMASLERTQVTVNIRINFYLTPDLSVQFWGQPFLFSGDYENYKLVVDPQNSDFQRQFHQFTEDEIYYDQYTNSYAVCESGFSASDCTPENPDYRFENPDFSFYEFRSNLVLRWEYIPGSFLYAVSSQNRVGDDGNGSFDAERQFGNMLNAQAENVFLIKFSYRFSF
jgi:hypothetical protein